jgi:hypothetical protein
MRKRGRISAAATVVPLSVNGLPPRIAAPPGLRTDEQMLFNELVGACDPRHFVETDIPLLVSYIQSTLLSRRAAANLEADPRLVTVWEKATRMQATLATRLRLAPQARTDPKTIARQQTAVQLGPPPWDAEDDDRHAAEQSW